MILSGPEILKQVELGEIVIDPFDPKRVNPASFDLTLGSEVAVYDRFTTRPWTNKETYDGHDLSYHQPLVKSDASYGHNTKESISVRKYSIDPRVGWILNPGVGYLMHTAEKVSTNKFVPILDGKSSIGRLFIQVHVTAGFGDPGYAGQYTLEVTSKFPVRVFPGMRICQMRFHVIQGEVTSYQRSGSYTGQLAAGPIGSQAHKSAFR